MLWQRPFPASPLTMPLCYIHTNPPIVWGAPPSPWLLPQSITSSWLLNGFFWDLPDSVKRASVWLQMPCLLFLRAPPTLFNHDLSYLIHPVVSISEHNHDPSSRCPQHTINMYEWNLWHDLTNKKRVGSFSLSPTLREIRIFRVFSDPWDRRKANTICSLPVISESWKSDYMWLRERHEYKALKGSKQTGRAWKKNYH